MPKRVDYSKYNLSIGIRYGKREIIGDKKRIKDNRYILCKCECGTEKYVKLYDLVNLRCSGCMKCRSYENYGKHNLSRNRIYSIYHGILQRCNNPKNNIYKYYGARGIKCLRNSFEEFYNDMAETYKEDLTIDRIDNNGDYCKKNCKWVTMKEQSNNRRDKRTALDYKGERMNRRNYGMIVIPPKDKKSYGLKIILPEGVKRVFEYFYNSDTQPTYDEASKNLGVSNTTIYHHIKTLEEFGLLTKDGNGRITFTLY